MFAAANISFATAQQQAVHLGWDNLGCAEGLTALADLTDEAINMLESYPLRQGQLLPTEALQVIFTGRHGRREPVQAARDRSRTPQRNPMMSSNRRTA